MDRLKKPKEFLEKLGLSDSDYQDSGMINHIADLLERYHTEQCNIADVSTRFLVRSKFCLTIVDDVERTEKEADKLVVQLNEGARQMDLGVRYEKIPVNV